MEEIKKVVKSLEISEENVSYYGKYIAKLDTAILNKRIKKASKLVLVTATNPTPFGEGKTTQSIGISMALNKLGFSSTVVLREPSLGPVFGTKGGATGGGKSIVIPSEDINLHFTGDFHAITSANNLICAIIDNHIFQGNELKIDRNTITIKRVMDMNDRALRNISLSSDGNNIDSYNSGFEITTACELMAICSLATDYEDLKCRIDDMLIAYSINKRPIYIKDLNCTNAVLALLKNVLKPNLVQTLEGTPAIIHLGPFANIAHGCNSIIATKIGLSLSDITVTEAGFGADLGAEKFLDIKCRQNGLVPDACVIVTTIKALKYNGGANVDELETENINYLKIGIKNLEKHIQNMKNFGVKVMVCLNKFDFDTQTEIDFVREFVNSLDTIFEVSTSFEDGSLGAINVAKSLVSLLEKQTKGINFCYNLEDSFEEKVTKIAKNIYGANNVIFKNEVKEKIHMISILGASNYPICMAKTPLSLSDNSALLGKPENFDVTVRDIRVNTGAKFIVVYTGNVLTMPGLGKHSNYERF